MDREVLTNRVVALLFLAASLSIGTRQALASDPETAPMPAPVRTVLTQEAAVWWALQNNPEIQATRQQRGIAAAGVVIARQYPFNPVLENKIRHNDGPISAAITNRVATEQVLTVEIEVHHQRRYREEAAGAALSRTEWEIAYQEASLGVRVLRAFDTQLYRQEKLKLLEQTVQLNVQAAGQVRKLVENARLRPVDLIVVNSEVDDLRAQVPPARFALTQAHNDFRRAIGLVDGTIELSGTLERPASKWDAVELRTLALEKRADFHARRLAVSEADAKLRLEIANRKGNPVVGPAYEYDPTRINLIGAQVNIPLPIFNKHKGEILQRQAERDKALLDLRQTEVQISQDVRAALDHLRNAEEWAGEYRQRALPDLEKAWKDMNKLFQQGDPGVDLLRVLDIRRKLLKAQDGYLDALWEISQARADLAAAVGDLSLTLPAQPKP